jgi:N-formylglutamate amidohydrolase
VYQQFYKDIKDLIEEKINEFGYFFILDIHSYNHRRVSPNQASDSELNPEVNLGTAYNTKKWHPIIDKFKTYLSGCIIKGEFLDVRENVKFKGGGFAQWLTQSYGDKGGIISIEFKKTFMDEWTGRADIPHIVNLHQALKSTLPLLLSELRNGVAK